MAAASSRAAAKYLNVACQTSWSQGPQWAGAGSNHGAGMPTIRQSSAVMLYRITPKLYMSHFRL
eukprot:14311699-Alexandrium_andersonii.AAC.1